MPEKWVVDSKRKSKNKTKHKKTKNPQIYALVASVSAPLCISSFDNFRHMGVPVRNFLSLGLFPDWFAFAELEQTGTNDKGIKSQGGTSAFSLD